MNPQSQVITGVEINCAAAMQGIHHVLVLIQQILPPSKRRTGQPYWLSNSLIFRLAFTKIGLQRTSSGKGKK